MVLKNSKWDKKARTKYLKKHGIITKPIPTETEQRPKWSSKRPGTSQQQMILEDSDSEWDSEEDEELLNHFYPEIGKEDLTREQREKIKQQILQDLVEEQENLTASQNEDIPDRAENEGIYLGSEENRTKENDSQESKAKLDAYVPKDPILTKAKKNRKLPKNRMQDNILEEYGIERYSDTMKKDINDYNLTCYSQKMHRNMDKISSSDLDGFRIGESSFMDKPKMPHKDKHIVRNLTEDEIQENTERAAKSEQNRFYNQIKSKFNIPNSNSDPTNRSKVIEINNFNENDERQLKNLNAKLVNNYQDTPVKLKNELDDDIDLLLGDYKPKIRTPDNTETGNNSQNIDNKINNNIDDFLSSLDISTKGETTATKNENKLTTLLKLLDSNPKYQDSKTLTDQDFLDDLLD